MKPVYVQHLLKVLLDEYEDIEFMLDAIDAKTARKADAARIRALLGDLQARNEKLLDHFGA